MMDGMVSIVLVTHNGGSALDRTIRGVLGQTCRPMELVVVDNGSDDGTPGLIAGLGPSRAGARIVSVRLAENAGVGNGRNAGARAATGDILVWMDDDCGFERAEAVAGLASEFQTDPTLAVRAYPVREERGRQVRYLVPRRMGRRPRSAKAESSYFLGAGCAMRASVFRDLGMFDGSLFYQLEELEFSYRLARARIPVRYAPHPMVVHAPRGRWRERRKRFFFFHTRNRIWLASRYLPPPVAAVHLGVWLPSLFVRSVAEGGALEFCRGFGAGIRGALGPCRACRLDGQTLRWLARRAGRVWC
jgi:GT2 family glycosyltransferase